MADTGGAGSGPGGGGGTGPRTGGLRLFTVPQVAEMFGCSRWQVYSLITSGALETVPLGGRGKRTVTRVPESSVAAYIQRNRRRATKPRAA